MSPNKNRKLVLRNYKENFCSCAVGTRQLYCFLKININVFKLTLSVKFGKARHVS